MSVSARVTSAEVMVMLRAWASGRRAAEAAVELLLAVFTPGDLDWLGPYVEVDGDAGYAEIYWDVLAADVAAGAVSWTSGDDCLLGIAASLGGGGPVSLQEVADLDVGYATVVLQALAYAAGWREQGHSVVIDGQVALPAADAAVAQ